MTDPYEPDKCVPVHIQFDVIKDIGNIYVPTRKLFPEFCTAHEIVDHWTKDLISNIYYLRPHC